MLPTSAASLLDPKWWLSSVWQARRYTSTYLGTQVGKYEAPIEENCNSKQSPLELCPGAKPTVCETADGLSEEVHSSSKRPNLLGSPKRIGSNTLLAQYVNRGKKIRR